jgi:hypothetical protein
MAFLSLSSRASPEPCVAKRPQPPQVTGFSLGELRVVIEHGRDERPLEQLWSASVATGAHTSYGSGRLAPSSTSSTFGLTYRRSTYWLANIIARSVSHILDYLRQAFRELRSPIIDGS